MRAMLLVINGEDKASVTSFESYLAVCRLFNLVPIYDNYTTPHIADPMPHTTFNDPEKLTKFQEELRALLNRYSIENESNTPDYILATYVIDCLKALHGRIKERERWYGYANAPGQDAPKRLY